jgi:hypothetical protein
MVAKAEVVGGVVAAVQTTTKPRKNRTPQRNALSFAASCDGVVRCVW